MIRLTVALGTRPEVIKLAPVVQIARRRGHDVKVLFTGQHREMVRPLLRFFGLSADVELDTMVPDQGLSGLSARVLAAMDQNREAIRSDLMIVQGDTTSALMAGYWAFTQRIPVAHV